MVLDREDRAFLIQCGEVVGTVNTDSVTKARTPKNVTNQKIIDYLDACGEEAKKNAEGEIWLVADVMGHRVQP